MLTEQQYADVSDLSYIRSVKDALSHMNIGDMETAPAEMIEIYRRLCRDSGALRTYLEKSVDEHTNTGE